MAREAGPGVTANEFAAERGKHVETCWEVMRLVVFGTGNGTGVTANEFAAEWAKHVKTC